MDADYLWQRWGRINHQVPEGHPVGKELPEPLPGDRNLGNILWIQGRDLVGCAGWVNTVYLTIKP